MLKAHDTNGYSDGVGKLFGKRRFSPTKTFLLLQNHFFFLTFFDSHMGNFGADKELRLLTFCHKFRLTIIRVFFFCSCNFMIFFFFLATSQKIASPRTTVILHTCTCFQIILFILPSHDTENFRSCGRKMNPEELSNTSSQHLIFFLSADVFRFLCNIIFSVYVYTCIVIYRVILVIIYV